MRRFAVPVLICMLSSPCFAGGALDSAIISAHEACGGIAAEMNRMKTIAGINIAVTSVGTLAGGGALATGLAKSRKDKALEELRKMDEKYGEEDGPTEGEIEKFLAELDRVLQLPETELNIQIEVAKKDLERQSQRLGNWRTGLLAGNTATNVAGAVIAGRNKVGEDLQADIDDCRAVVSELARTRLQSRADGLSDADPMMSRAQRIIDGCRDYDTVTDAQINSINKRANAAMWAGIAGATVGAAGTVTSAIANTDATRKDDSNKEKNLNKASNVLAGGATVASAVAIVFNATQISAIKRISAAADNCEGAMR